MDTIIVGLKQFICFGVNACIVCCLAVARLLDMVRESFGTDAARNVMSVEPDNLPIILIVFKSKGKVEVRNVIQGLSLHPIIVYYDVI